MEIGSHQGLNVTVHDHEYCITSICHKILYMIWAEDPYTMTPNQSKN